MIWLKDSRGRASVTLTFVAPALLAVIARFVLAEQYGFPPFSGGDFAFAFGAIGAFWWGREHTEKRDRE